MNESTTITPPVAARGNGFGVAALVLGIIGVVFCWVPVFGLLLGALAAIFGAVGYVQAGGGMSIAGGVLGVITVAIGIIVIVALAGAAGSAAGPLTGSSLSAPATSDAINDVKVTACNSGNGPLGMSGTTVAVTNSTDRTQTYLITVSLNNADGNRLGEAIGAVNSVAPGQTATSDLFGGGTHTEGVTSCAVANVDRVPS